MVRCSLLLLIIILSYLTASGQTLLCRTGHVNVKSSNRLSEIEADNYQVQSTLDINDGSVEFIGLTKSFSLESGALDKAFNSQYVNVNGYSKFQFNGAITNLEEIDFKTHGEYTFDVKGILTVGEYQRTTITSGTLIVNKDFTIQVYSDFAIKIEEENVKQINTLLEERLGSFLNMSSLGVSRDIEISVLFNYK